MEEARRMWMAKLLSVPELSPAQVLTLRAHVDSAPEEDIHDVLRMKNPDHLYRLFSTICVGIEAKTKLKADFDGPPASGCPGTGAGIAENASDDPPSPASPRKLTSEECSVCPLSPSPPAPVVGAPWGLESISNEAKTKIRAYLNGPPRESISYLELLNNHIGRGLVQQVEGGRHLWEHKYVVNDEEFGELAQVFAKNLPGLMVVAREDIKQHPARWALRKCVTEPDESSDALANIYQQAARLVLGHFTEENVHSRNVTKYCQYQRRPEGGPDVAVGLTHPGTPLSNYVYLWCDLYLELKADESLLWEAAGQVLDRAEKRRKGDGTERKVVLGAVSTGILLQPMLVLTDVWHGNRMVMGSTCRLEGDEFPNVVDPGSRALPEIFFQIFFLMHRTRFLPPKLEPLGATELRYAVRSADSGEVWDVKLVCTYVDYLFRGGCYLVELSGGEFKQKVVLKRGSTEVAMRMAEAVGLPPQFFNQVQNEKRVREAMSGSGVRIPDILWSGWGVEPLGWRNCPVVLMSYMGESLHGKTLPLAEAAEMGASLVETVRELHKRGIIHRDISPRNVAYCEQASGLDKFYLLDCGLASFVSDGAELSPVKDLEFGSMDSLFGRAVEASADMEGILYTMVKVAGMELPWSADAQDEDEDSVYAIRRQVLERGFIAKFEHPFFSQLQDMVFLRGQDHLVDVNSPTDSPTERKRKRVEPEMKGSDGGC